jgi:hypothetical protein
MVLANEHLKFQTLKNNYLKNTEFKGTAIMMNIKERRKEIELRNKEFVSSEMGRSSIRTKITAFSFRQCWDRQVILAATDHWGFTPRCHSRHREHRSCSLPHWRSHTPFICW